MLEVRLAGQPYEMGLQHAEQVNHLRNSIGASLDAFVASVRLDQAVRREMRRFDDYLTSHASTTWEMYRGTVDGLGFRWEDMTAYALRNYLTSKRYPEGCTVLADAREGSSSPLLAKTRDYYREHESIQMLGFAAPVRGLRFLFLGSAGSPGVFGSGMNEAGLAVADNHVPTTDIGIGLPSYALMQGLLENSHNVEEGVSYLESRTHMGSTNLTLVDANGMVAVCESAHSGPRIRLASKSFEVSTNHFTDAQLARTWKGSHNDLKNSEGRKERTLREMSDDSNSTFGRMVSLLSGHGEGAVCRHGEGDRYGTILAAVYRPASYELCYSPGTPCTGKWVRLNTAPYLGPQTS